MAIAEPDKLVTVIGRGHSGTRAAARLLQGGGVYMGEPLNGSMDLIPKPNTMYEAARIAGSRIRVDLKTMTVDADDLLGSDPPQEFVDLVHRYLEAGGLAGPRPGEVPWRGWKLPETVFCYPWLTELFPDMRFLRWGRDPRGTLLKPHGTDPLGFWHVQGVPASPRVEEQRAISWAVQTWLILNTPEPRYGSWATLEAWAWNDQAAPELGRMSLELGGVPLGGVGPNGRPCVAWMHNPVIARGTRELGWCLDLWAQWCDRVPAHPDLTAPEVDTSEGAHEHW